MRAGPPGEDAGDSELGGGVARRRAGAVRDAPRASGTCSCLSASGVSSPHVCLRAHARRRFSPRASRGPCASATVRTCDARLASSPFSSCISLHPSHPSLHVSKVLLTDMKTRPRENLCTNAHNDPMHGSQDVQTDMSVGRRRGRRSADGRSAPPQHQRPSHVVGPRSDACHHRPRAAGFQSRALSRMGESRRGKAGRRSRGVRAEPER